MDKNKIIKSFTVLVFLFLTQNIFANECNIDFSKVHFTSTKAEQVVDVKNKKMKSVYRQYNDFLTEMPHEVKMKVPKIEGCPNYIEIYRYIGSVDHDGHDHSKDESDYTSKGVIDKKLYRKVVLSNNGLSDPINITQIQDEVGLKKHVWALKFVIGDQTHTYALPIGD